jgi:hypothetical protein
MRWWTTAIVLALLGALTRTVDINAAEKFQKLTGAQIQAKFAGMEMSDDVHWRDRYERNGTIASQSMGRNRSGKWRVEKNELCVDLGTDRGGCYEVWLAGNKVEFRREGLDGSILEGTLQNSSGRR